jgi:hypothetical protein
VNVPAPPPSIELYWIPLGAGAHVVRLSGRVFESLTALVQRRSRCDLYHSALVVTVPDGRFVVEQAPVIDADGPARGVVVEGPVGFRWLGRFRVFRYEVRCWAGGEIPDLDQAVGGAVLVAGGNVTARRLLDLVATVPAPVWGRDELAAGEMWNSNSVVSWLLVRSGVDLSTVTLPPGGRAPGWDAGRVVAARPG